MLVTMIYAMFVPLSAPDSYYPHTVDGLGHLTKIRFLAESWKQWQWPSWYSNWYVGSTVTQYYPPFSYVLLAVFQVFTNNVLHTFTYSNILLLFVGSMGVWYFCYRFIGRWVGILGGFLYALQPYLLISLMLSGVLAQGPIYALTPWLLYFTVAYFHKPTKGLWMMLCATSFIMVISHPMHMFMVCMCFALVAFPFLIYKKMETLSFLSWLAALGLGVGLAGFWWMTGVTKFENPTIPYLLEEATLAYTANFQWFNSLKRASGISYSSLSCILVGCASGIYLYMTRKNVRKIDNRGVSVTAILYVFALLIFTTVFSFGQNLPFFKYFPAYKTLVPGRILSLTACCSPILVVYFLKSMMRNFKSKVLAAVFVLAIFTIIFIDIDPGTLHFQVNDNTPLTELFQKLPDVDKQAYDKGRHTWITPITSTYTYFPELYNYNTADGWNIEGTPHNRALWAFGIALSAKCESYVVKKMLQWNVRSLIVGSNYISLLKALDRYGYQYIDVAGSTPILFNSRESSYYWKKTGEAFVIGKSAPVVEMNFPWFATGDSAKLEDYPDEILDSFKLIYFAEPEIKDMKKFEQRVRELSAKGKTIIIELGNVNNRSLFGVMPYDVQIGSSDALVKNENVLMQAKYQAIPFYEGSYSHAFTGLDEVYYTVKQKDNPFRYQAIGAKIIDNRKIYFVGCSLSQKLTSGVIRAWGLVGVQPFMSERDTLIRDTLQAVMDKESVNKSIDVVNFPIISHKWVDNGATIQYQNDKAEDMVISVTYTPRWQATVDGSPVKLYNYENLMLLKLPKGLHEIKLEYVDTAYGKAGNAVSVVSLLCIIGFIWYFDWLFMFVSFLLNKSGKYLEIWE
ncbi:MAG: hypothetical protein H7Y41_02090 [Hyphomonadaceae bacterium]|nr:hypothetical protein [Clostridia bacterium]